MKCNLQKYKFCFDLIKRGVYIIDFKEGKIYNLNGKEKKCPISKEGYRRVKLHLNGINCIINFHVLVWMAYNEQIVKNGLVIDHIDGNTLNNKPSNLQQISVQENTQRGKSSKLNKYQVKEIANSYREEIDSFSNIAKKYNVSEGTIRNVLKGITWKNYSIKPIGKQKRGPKSKLNKTKVKDIKKRLKIQENYKDIAMLYSVNPRTILKIKYGERWSEK